MFDVFRGNWKIGKAVNLGRSEFGVDVDRITGIVSRPGDPAASVLREETRAMVESLDLNEKELALTLIVPFAKGLPVTVQERIRQRTLFWANLGVVRRDIAGSILDEIG